MINLLRPSLKDQEFVTSAHPPAQPHSNRLSEKLVGSAQNQTVLSALKHCLGGLFVISWLVLLAGCGDAPIATTTGKNQGALTISFVTTNSVNPTPTSNGSLSATFPADGSFPGILALFDKVSTATRTASSYRYVSLQVTRNVRRTTIYQSPDRRAITTTVGTRFLSSRIFMGRDFYSSEDGLNWTKELFSNATPNPTAAAEDGTLLTNLRREFYTGATFILLPDEISAQDGRRLGVFKIDFSTATGASQSTRNRSIITKYDKTTCFIYERDSKDTTGDLIETYSDYNSPANVVEPPKNFTVSTTP